MRWSQYLKHVMGGILNFGQRGKDTPQIYRLPSLASHLAKWKCQDAGDPSGFYHS